MDQRVKGGTPPTAASALDSTSAPEDSKQDQEAEKKRRGEGESGNVGKKEEEKRGAGGKREGDKGAVLELLIEGRCGGQQELQLSGRESNCPEGNVRVRIGLQAKRTKKPPKILESYVCKPTIRTYQRQGRGAPLRADGEGRAVQENKGVPATDGKPRCWCRYCSPTPAPRSEDARPNDHSQRTRAKMRSTLHTARNGATTFLLLNGGTGS
uniref:ASH1 like histone lysine methyltransferase n=1 Tax=Fundulus heteroclitus TaxID=8078 RepID=A0A3Q2R088_FUNHE